MIDTSSLGTVNELPPRREPYRVGHDGRVVNAESARLLDMATKLVREGQARRAVRALLEQTNDWMLAGRTNVCLALLRTADVRTLDVTASIGLLAALDPVRDQTREARDRFIAALRAYLVAERPGDADELMRGIR